MFNGKINARRWILGLLCPLMAASAFGQGRVDLRRTIDQGIKEGTFQIPENPNEGQMPLSYTIRSWQLTRIDDDTWTRYLDLQKGLGFNNISIDLAWKDVEPEQGKYDFTKYDARLKMIVDRGMSLQLKLNTRDLPDWARANPVLLVHGPDGQVIVEENMAERPYHTFADEQMNRWLRGYYKAVGQHYADWPNLFFCSAFAKSFESEYHHTIWADYSPPAQRQFRAWAREHYGDDLEAANQVWGTGFTKWDEVMIPWTPPEDADNNPVAGVVVDGKPDRRYVDFMKYREWSAGLFFQNIYDGLKEGNPKAQYGPQVGRIVGPFAMRRGSLGVFGWLPDCEWIFTDPAPSDDYPWELAVARAGGRKVAIELDGPYMYRNLNLHERQPELYAEQTRLSYEHGADYLTYANWGSEWDYARNLEMFAKVAKIKQETFTKPVADEAVYVSKWDCYLQGNSPEGNMTGAHKQFSRLRETGKTVDVVLDDIMLHKPETLKKYKKIHLNSVRFMDKAVWEVVKASGVELVIGEEVNELMDETGGEGWSAR